MRFSFVALFITSVFIPESGISIQTTGLMPDFNFTYLFANGAGQAFCMMTPLYIGILTIYYPIINIVTLRITSIVGLIAALVNFYIEFILYPDKMWWVGVLHLPLLIISFYGLILSLIYQPPKTEHMDSEYYRTCS